jgi:3',5'-cyclic AMP phosphodiesterase CpdA
MSVFRLTQISDTHLARRQPKLTANFDRIRDYIDATRPDLVLNSGDLAFDAPTAPDDLAFAKELHDALPDPWRFDAAGWCFIGLNSLVMNSGLRSEAEQLDWLASELAGASASGQPVALFLHKPLFLKTPEDPELPDSAIRYVPVAARRRLLDLLGVVDLRLIASGHVHQRRDFTYHHTRHIWGPSAGFVISDTRQERIGTKETGLVEYRFRPDSFEVRHIKAPGQTDVDLDELLGRKTA